MHAHFRRRSRGWFFFRKPGTDGAPIDNQQHSGDRNQNNPFAGKLDLTKIALAGHSLGGLTTWHAVHQDARYKAPILLHPHLSRALLKPTETTVMLLAAGRCGVERGGMPAVERAARPKILREPSWCRASTAIRCRMASKGSDQNRYDGNRQNDRGDARLRRGVSRREPSGKAVGSPAGRPTFGVSRCGRNEQRWHIMPGTVGRLIYASVENSWRQSRTEEADRTQLTFRQGRPNGESAK